MLSDTLVMMAREYLETSFGDKETCDRYLEVCFPGDTPADARSMGSRMYSCLMFARGIAARQKKADGSPEIDGEILWRGKRIDALRCPYVQHIGMIENLLYEHARQHGGLKERLWLEPEAPVFEGGDVVVIGKGGSKPIDPAAEASWRREWGGVAHGLVVLEVEPKGDLVVVTSADGGQIDPKNLGRPTAIRECVRYLERRENGWWLVDEGTGKARRLNYRIRFSVLPSAP